MKLSAKVKKIIALCICCALLAVAIIQNVYTGLKEEKQEAAGSNQTEGDKDVLSNDGEDLESSGDEDSVTTGLKCDSVEDYFSGLRLERDEVRSLAAEECMAIIENETAADEEKSKAQETVQSIGMMQEIENSLETALKSKGYQDVFVNYDNDGEIDVTLVADNLVQDEVSAIASIIQTSTGISIAKMSVQNVYE
ncbi:MAG: SpoIIIAH-like family protein [Clostridia bacterium]|nr:SpoIIIAH-like family protein [Clostridia bacterium]